MKINILEDSKKLGLSAAQLTAKELTKSIETQGYARLLLSTGSSQFDTIDALVKEDIDWSKVEMFHLDEYIGLPEGHIASFRKYLKERFLNHINIKEAILVNGEAEDLGEELKRLEKKLREKPVDVALIGIGENGHIAFNDPTADFETKEAYFEVELDEKCKNQQVGEGWFENLETVPTHAISMTVHQIMQSKLIISCVPHEVKAQAIADTFKYKLDPNYPSTMLKYHENWHLYVDLNSSKYITNK